MKKIASFIILGFLMTNVNANDLENINYIYQAKKDLKVSINNNSEQVQQPIIPQGYNICSIQFKNLKIYNIASSLSKINIIEDNNQNFDFGNVLTDVRNYAIFDNATVITGGTWSNANYYHARYAIDGYELPEHGIYAYWLGFSYLTINLNPHDKNIIGMNLRDIQHCVGGCIGANVPYDIELYSCENELIKTIPITEPVSPAISETGYVSFL